MHITTACQITNTLGCETAYGKETSLQGLTGRGICLYTAFVESLTPCLALCIAFLGPANILCTLSRAVA